MFTRKPDREASDVESVCDRCGSRTCGGVTIDVTYEPIGLSENRGNSYSLLSPLECAAILT